MSRRPLTVPDLLCDLAEWLDETDALISQVAAERGSPWQPGDEMQTDLRLLALWIKPDTTIEDINAWLVALGDEPPTPARRDR